MEELDDEKVKLLEMSMLSIVINDYNDIFSTFDPRKTDSRAISDDFLFEVRRASKEKVSEGLELRIMVPGKRRDLNEERSIRKRLWDYFKKKNEETKKEVKKIRNLGIGMVLLGVLLMFLATFILFKYPEKSFLVNFLIIVLEPGGWFFFWEGLYQIILEPKTKRQDLDFYSKMAKSEITFNSY